MENSLQLDETIVVMMIRFSLVVSSRKGIPQFGFNFLFQVIGNCQVVHYCCNILKLARAISDPEWFIRSYWSNFKAIAAQASASARAWW